MAFPTIQDAVSIPTTVLSQCLGTGGGLVCVLFLFGTIVGKVSEDTGVSFKSVLPLCAFNVENNGYI